MKNLLDLTKDELRKEMESIGMKSFKGNQVFKWIYSGINTIDDMKNISNSHKDMIKNNYELKRISLVKKYEDVKDGTKKYLFSLQDNNIIETVLMKYKYGYTLCISSQAGCRMGCEFCASTIDGLERNLTVGEMTDQIMSVEQLEGVRISNIVVMGSGEPLDNFDNTVKFIKVANDPDGLNKGQRHLSISTCGLVPEIYKLADLSLQINLSVSLHAPNDDLRRQLMPIAKKYSLNELMKACRYYYEKTNRKITFEYAMISRVNDTAECARMLAGLLKDMENVMVNLIPMNEIDERDYKKSADSSVEQFSSILSKENISHTVRRKLGTEIEAACGQLRRGHKNP
ncbi:23S rRNA (adenine(2503)-C(2))-methyltransferase RlmN [Alkalibacter saccharofermentans]|uniref:Probable dual-specificity RNA methyltransferase RlmN n=1 Tax=Alkalibacter saccharofermentans DSM 14828 TaxID=1120975 RepID=A0A1M4S548_9FIRM|nr:23S rRNA (adenine(2503)-C(2))-methyltransferase RlmN [Alkalibacter saccharofermentans]SHE27309.1 23S rRNA m(2)A-2503 methyltransferase [Alkalibacter saccharofermentans DSM 14828]